MFLSEAIGLIESVSETTDWASKVKASPSTYGISARTLPSLLDMVSRYKAGQFGAQLSVFEVKIGPQKRLFATDQRTLKRALSASEDFSLVGHILPQRKVGQKPTWMPKR